VGGEMMISDPFVVKMLHPSQAMLYAAEAVAMAGILVAGRILTRASRNAAVISRN
jgi:hypothetical protein